jgi:hypothetical protein
LPLMFMLPRGMLPAGLMVPAGLAGCGMPMGEALRCRPLVEPMVPLPALIGIVAPTMLSAGEGELPRVVGLAGKTTTLAPVPLLEPPKECGTVIGEFKEGEPGTWPWPVMRDWPGGPPCPTGCEAAVRTLEEPGGVA